MYYTTYFKKITLFTKAGSKYRLFIKKYIFFNFFNIDFNANNFINILLSIINFSAIWFFMIKNLYVICELNVILQDFIIEPISPPPPPDENEEESCNKHLANLLKRKASFHFSSLISCQKRWMWICVDPPWYVQLVKKEMIQSDAKDVSMCDFHTVVKTTCRHHRHTHDWHWIEERRKTPFIYFSWQITDAFYYPKGIVRSFVIGANRFKIHLQPSERWTLTHPSILTCLPDSYVVLI